MNSERLQLKRAVELLVRSAGGIEAVASLLGKGKSVVGRWTNRNDEEHSINLADLRELEANAPEPLVTIALARMAGGVFVPHIDLSADEGTVPFLAMQLAKELGDVTGEIALAMADGAISAREAEGVLAQLDELDTKSAQLRAAMKRIGEAEAK